MNANGSTRAGRSAEFCETVRAGGERAVLDLTRRYDGARRDTLEVEPGGMGARRRRPWMRRRWPPSARRRARIHRFARAQRQSLRPFRLREDGIVLEQRLLPVARAGVYAPGGRHPLCSSVLMGAVPASVAGCREVVLATPPRPDGTVHPAVLAAARIAAVDRIFAMGGAQAIAALAFGAGSVPAVDVIVGPGNRFVTEAKTAAARPRGHRPHGRPIRTGRRRRRRRRPGPHRRGPAGPGGARSRMRACGCSPSQRPIWPAGCGGAFAERWPPCRSARPTARPRACRCRSLISRTSPAPTRPARPPMPSHPNISACRCGAPRRSCRGSRRTARSSSDRLQRSPSATTSAGRTTRCRHQEPRGTPEASPCRGF